MCNFILLHVIPLLTLLQALNLQREAWLTRCEGNYSRGSQRAATTAAMEAAPKLLRRRRPASSWSDEEGRGLWEFNKING